MQGAGCRVQGAGCRVQGAGLTGCCLRRARPKDMRPKIESSQKSPGEAAIHASRSAIETHLRRAGARSEYLYKRAQCTNIYAFTNICTHFFAYSHTCIHIHEYILIYIYIYIYMYIHIHVYKHSSMYFLYIYIYPNKLMHLCVYIYRQRMLGKGFGVEVFGVQ